MSPSHQHAHALAEGFRAAVELWAAAAPPREQQNIARRIPGRRRDPDRLLHLNGVDQLRQPDHYRLLGGVAGKASCGAVERAATGAPMRLHQGAAGAGVVQQSGVELEPAAGSTGRSATTVFWLADHIKTLAGLRQTASGSAGQRPCCFPPMWTKLFEPSPGSASIPGLHCSVSMRRPPMRCAAGTGIDVPTLIRRSGRTSRRRFFASHRGCPEARGRLGSRAWVGLAL